MATPHPNQIAFKEGVQYLFHSWTALKLAVDGEWGGHDSVAKRDWFVETIVDYFSERKEEEAINNSLHAVSRRIK